jgi:hypothetical protein
LGQIKLDVRRGHLTQYPSEEELLRPFLDVFHVTWGGRRRSHNTELSVYFLSPEQQMQDQFGFDAEIMLVISPYPTLQARTMQAVEQIIDESPAKGRVDQGFFFVITEDSSAGRWFNNYMMRNPQTRIPVAFIGNDLRISSGDAWAIRNTIAHQLFTRDLFDFQLPIISDLFFFGRDALVAEFTDAIKQSQNRGLFGLRKTGKTSSLFKVRRHAEREDNLVFYYDCKNPAIRSQTWELLLDRVSVDILKQINKTLGKDANKFHVSDRFTKAIERVPKKHNICLIFDEIEYISPIAKLDQHWHADFLPFWQTLWTAQSESRRLSFVIAGVNPTIVELDTVGGVQNPMFGIVRPSYLKGFEEPELKSMIRYFGRRMGLKFSEGAIGYIRDQYGGHPLLTRMACSHIHRQIDSIQTTRPFDITEEFLKESEKAREEEISFYSGHVVSELKEFYPTEFELLEILASGNVADFVEFANEPAYIKHLKDYGLVDVSDVGRPHFLIPVVGKYISSESTQRAGAKHGRYVIPASQRDGWLKTRLESIIREQRYLEKIIFDNGLPQLFGKNGFPEAERFCKMAVVSNQEEFEAFINVCNRCLVEPVQNFGKKIGNKNYYWVDVKKYYPDIWDALNRIKVYRNDNFHIELNKPTEIELKRYLEKDLYGKRPSQVKDLYFILQQSVIDELFVSILCELNRHS